MITVQFSKGKELILPESLGRALGLSEGDRVEVRRHSRVLWFRRRDTLAPPGPLTDLASIVSSSHPMGSVDIEKNMNKHGYEQLDDRFDLRL